MMMREAREAKFKVEDAGCRAANHEDTLAACGHPPQSITYPSGSSGPFTNRPYGTDLKCIQICDMKIFD